MTLVSGIKVLNDLQRLTPLGVLTADGITLPSPEPEASDGWNWLPPGLFPPEYRWLELLSQLNVVRLTYKICSGVHVRVYVVPEDIHRSNHLLNQTGRKALTRLLSNVNTSEDAWNAKPSEFREAIPARTRSLAQIYNNIESPTGLHPSIPLSPYNKSALDAIMQSEIPGLASQLYPYQARTVHRLLLQEISPRNFNDPEATRITTPVNGVYLYLSSNFKLWTSCSSYEAPKGGILGEEMGSGKTCETLALILVSLGQMPENPALGFGSTLYLPTKGPGNASLKSLQQISAEAVQVSAVPWRWQQWELSEQCLAHLALFRQSYIIPPPPLRARPRRAHNDDDRATEVDTRPGTQIWLSHGTLVVVPDTLVSQWRHEISKHVQADVLRVLIIASAKKSEGIPSVEDLLKYDLVLISHSRFSREEERIGMIQRCFCSYAGATREVECTCPPPITYTSPLISIHWLRLVVDEGHTMSSSHTKAMRFASTLNVERKWVVSGTPSRGLVGSSADGQEGAQDERNDLDRVAITLIEFLGMKALDKQAFKKYVTKPFLDRAPGSEQLVTDLFNSVIVRNRQVDIQKDVVLPPLTKRIISLDASPVTVLSQNIFNALIATNAVTSQREDQDYFFHKSQNAALQAIVRNMLQSTFYWTGTAYKDVEGAYNVATHALKVNGDRFSEADKALLKTSIEIFEEAMNNVVWLQTSEKHEMAYYLNDMLPSETRKYYSILGSEGKAYSGTAMADAQNAVRDGLSTFMYNTEVDNHLNHSLGAAGIKKRAREAKEMERELERSTKRQDTSSSPSKSPGLNSPTSTKKSALSRAVPRLVAKRNTQLAAAAASEGLVLAGDELSQPQTTPIVAVETEESKAEQSRLLLSSKLSSIRITHTSSAKLNYLLSQIAKHSGNEKIIVFSDFVDHTFHLAEALDICGVQYLLYTSSLSAVRKSQYIMTFNTSETFRVIIMDLHLAAHGLNLSTASRVYFLRQVWSGAIESQAIKRAHRIGQTRPVEVEVLILKDTIEEAMQKRRLSLTAVEIGNTKTITDDSVLRSAIKHPKFIRTCPAVTPIAGSFPMFYVGSRDLGDAGLVPAEDVPASTPLSRAVSEAGTPISGTPRRKARKRVQFGGDGDGEQTKRIKREDEEEMKTTAATA